MQAKIAVLPGDGIGREVTDEAVRLLQTVAATYNHSFDLVYGQIGGAAYAGTGSPLPEETVRLCQSANGILLGAVGGPQWMHLPPQQRPEAGLLGLRKALSLYANLRPIRVWPELADASPLRPEVLRGTDFVIVRELTGGLYFGEPRYRRVGSNGQEAVDTLQYTEQEIERLVTIGFELAEARRRHLTSVDKANVLESSRLWREVVDRVHERFADVQVEHMLVDTAAMQLVKNPRQFDVVVTENLFGDILSDEAATLTGSIGMLPSASLSGTGPGLFEPIHGSAPDIAGQQIANPLAAMLSAALLLRHSCGLVEEADAVESAIRTVIEEGARTKDIAGDGELWLTTQAMGERVRHVIERRHTCAANTIR